MRSPSGGLARLRADGTNEKLWAAGGGHFSKGLIVVGQVAYFGLARKQAGHAGARLDRNRAQAELAAYDLAAGSLLWRRPLPWPGLVNALGAPGLCATAPWRTCDDADAPADDAARTDIFLATAAAPARHLPDASAWLGEAAQASAKAAAHEAAVERQGWLWLRLVVVAALSLMVPGWARRCLRRRRRTG